MEIKVGSTVNIKIVKSPTNEAAVKTLRRVLCKDETFATEKKRLDKVAKANFKTKRRGGRAWIQQLVKQHPAKGEVGESGVLFASSDVIADLRSVSRFIEVTPA